MDKEVLYHKLEDYLAGRLGNTERNALQKQINEEEEVAELLAFVRLEKELGAMMLDEELEAQMKEWTAEKDALRTKHKNSSSSLSAVPEKKNKRNRFGLLGTLLGIALVLFVGYKMFYTTSLSNTAPVMPPPTGITTPPKSNKPPEDQPPNPINKESPNKPVPQQVPAKRQQPIASNPTTISKTIEELALAQIEGTSPIVDLNLSTAGSQNEDESPIEKGARLMTENKLEEAIEVLEAIPMENEAMTTNAKQYLAYIYFEQARYEEAIPIFKDLIASEYLDMEKMKWYLTLALLVTKQQAEGLKLIQEVINNENDPGLQAVAKGFLDKVKDN